MADAPPFAVLGLHGGRERHASFAQAPEIPEDASKDARAGLEKHIEAMREQGHLDPTGEADVVRVRLFLSDGTVVDEDLPYPELRTLEELVEETARKRLAELEKGVSSPAKSKVIGEQPERIVYRGAEAKAIKRKWDALHLELLDE